MIKENEKYACYEKAIHYLSFKSRSKKEIQTYLEKLKFTHQDISFALNLLEEKKMIDDDVYLKLYIEEQLALTRFGPKKIENKLLALGINEEKIKNELAKIDSSVWKEKLQNLLMKKSCMNKKDGQKKIREKLIQTAINEGYEKELALSLLEQVEIPTNLDALKKVAEKLYQKLSLKYEGSSLEYQLKAKLYQKGFTLEEIETVLNQIKKSSNR